MRVSELRKLNYRGEEDYASAPERRSPAKSSNRTRAGQGAPFHPPYRYYLYEAVTQRLPRCWQEALAAPSTMPRYQAPFADHRKRSRGARHSTQAGSARTANRAGSASRYDLCALARGDAER